jgi:hypothetical protein
MASMGPVEYVVIAFPGNRFKGEIVPAVAELVDNDVVRILDVAFIKKDADGNVTMFEYDSLDDVLEFGFADVDGEAGGVLNDEDLELAAEALEPDSSAALIVWEHGGRRGSPRRSGMRAGASSPGSGGRTRSWSRRWTALATGRWWPRTIVEGGTHVVTAKHAKRPARPDRLHGGHTGRRWTVAP